MLLITGWVIGALLVFVVLVSRALSKSTTVSLCAFSVVGYKLTIVFVMLGKLCGGVVNARCIN